MSCIDIVLQNLYIIGLASTFTGYSTLLSTINFISARNKRHMNICLGAWVLLIFNILYIISFMIPDMGSLFVGIIPFLHNISLLFCSLASISRYTQDMEGESKKWTRIVCNGIIIAFEISCIGITFLDTLIFGDTLRKTRHCLTLFIPIAHLVFGIVYAYLRYQRYQAPQMLLYSQKSRNECFLQISMTILIIVSWMVYFILGVSEFQNSPFIGSTLLLCQSITLLCENSIEIQKNIPKEEKPQDMSQRDFFTSPVVE